MHPNSLIADKQINRTRMQSKVYHAIEVLGNPTDQEIGDFLNRPASAISGRVGELIDAGQIEEHGEFIRVWIEDGKHRRQTYRRTRIV